MNRNLQNWYKNIQLGDFWKGFESEEWIKILTQLLNLWKRLVKETDYSRKVARLLVKKPGFSKNESGSLPALRVRQYGLLILVISTTSMVLHIVIHVGNLLMGQEQPKSHKLLAHLY